ncbi:hypothetical protein [Paludisphaera rhizosphaerae]|uniref:hypothetical protein n=1 Tax=Paludisphaera rhizosphaerae TaxID=2711216 RepID=UPI0013ED7CC0|nr:hypothetical protein [Paludisphaera rhizosphaerae]
MTRAIFIDPARTEKDRPAVGDRKNGFSISPFEIPYEMQVFGESSLDHVLSIRFSYPGGETGTTRSDIPSFGIESDVDIRIRSGRLSGKILEMTFGRPVNADELAQVAGRLKEASTATLSLSTKFNYQMISRILSSWREIIEASDIS